MFVAHFHKCMPQRDIMSSVKHCVIQTWKDTNKNINYDRIIYTIKVCTQYCTAYMDKMSVIDTFDIAFWLCQYLCWHVYPLKGTDALMCLNSIMTDDVFIRKWQQLFCSIIDQILSCSTHNGHYSINYVEQIENRFGSTDLCKVITNAYTI